MFNWLMNRLNREAKLRTEPLTLPAPAAFSTAAFSPPVNLPQLGVYEQSPWVYVAVNRIAEAGALVPLHVYQLDGDHKQAVVQHPLERLLDAPNPFMSGFELLEQTLGALELTGNAYWYLGGQADGTPAEIWALRPDRVTVVPDSDQRIRGYVYEVDGVQVPLAAVEVVHFKRWNPNSDYYGLSALQAARVAVTSDKAMAEWNRNTFGQDNGVPAGIVNIKEAISDTDFERLKREWRSSYGGVQRRTAFLRGGTVEWQNIGMSHTDLDFLAGRQAHRDEILTIFGVPVALVSENATEANAKVAERLFIERTLYPKLVRLQQKITQDLLPFWAHIYGECVAQFEDIRPTDTHLRLEEIQTASAILSINELRARYYDLPPVDWGAFPVNFRASSVPQSDALPAPTEPTIKQLSTDDETPSVAQALAQWERYALKRLGKPNARRFVARGLPDAVVMRVEAGLAAAQTEAAVKAVFEAEKAPPQSDDVAAPLLMDAGDEAAVSLENRAET